jgi:hypothetical protein
VTVEKLLQISARNSPSRPLLSPFSPVFICFDLDAHRKGKRMNRACNEQAQT